MGIEANTVSESGAVVIPATTAEWSDWVSATQTRAYLLQNPLIDWLNLYGSSQGYVRDTDREGYDTRLAFAPFIMRKGSEFEAAISTYLESKVETVVITKGPREIRELTSAENTFHAMEEGWPIIRQGVVRDAENRTFGAPDFLVRSDVLETLFPGHLAPHEAEISAPHLGNNPWHYVIIDAKFTTLRLLAGGKVGNSGSSPAYKAQLFIYNRALGRIQGYTPQQAFLLGRGWTQTINKTDLRGLNAVERLGPVTMDPPTQAGVKAACGWVRRLRAEGAQWSILPNPSVPELWPNAGEDNWPWQKATSLIANELNEITQLWNVGPDKRFIAHSSGIFSWRDPLLTPEIVKVSGPTTAPTLQAFLDINRTEGGPPVAPAHISAAENYWRPTSALEFFVDFETVNNLNDDFARIPEQNGQPLIYMVGCGHVSDGEWNFRSFVVDRLTKEAEGRMVDQWISHMNAVATQAQSDDARVVHWSFAEPSSFESAYNTARSRHPGKNWPVLHWFDLWSEVFRAEPVVVRGSLSFGLKSVARALHKHGFIETSWGDSQVDGQGAMVGAWWCDQEAAKNGDRIVDTSLMQEIAEYNEVDCKVMMEILHHLRADH